MNLHIPNRFITTRKISFIRIKDDDVEALRFGSPDLNPGRYSENYACTKCSRDRVGVLN